MLRVRANLNERPMTLNGVWGSFVFDAVRRPQHCQRCLIVACFWDSCRLLRGGQDSEQVNHAPQFDEMGFHLGPDFLDLIDAMSGGNRLASVR